MLFFGKKQINLVMLFDYNMFLSNWEKRGSEIRENSRATQICGADTVQKGIVVNTDNLVETMTGLYGMKKEFASSELTLLIPENRVFSKTVDFDSPEKLNQEKLNFLGEVPYDPKETVVKVVTYGNRARIMVIPIGSYTKVADALIKSGNKVTAAYPLSTLITKKYYSAAKEIYVYRMQNLMVYLITQNGVILHTVTHPFVRIIDNETLGRQVDEIKQLPQAAGVTNTVFLINPGEQAPEKYWIDPLEVAAGVIIAGKAARAENLIEGIEISQAVLEKFPKSF